MKNFSLFLRVTVEGLLFFCYRFRLVVFAWLR